MPRMRGNQGRVRALQGRLTRLPELPEVETVARQLDKVLTGLEVTGLRVFDAKLRDGQGVALTSGRIKGREVSNVRRVGKQIVLELAATTKSRGKLWLVCHLRMTGRLVYVEQPQATPNKHLRAKVVFCRRELQFVDLRRFGTLRLHNDPAQFAAPGLDPTTPAFTASKLKKMLASSQQEIKAWLLRQDKLTGIGNIYACEVLFAARIAPSRSAASLDAAEVGLLHRAIKRILKAAIKNCGTTFSDFQDSRGSIGGYQRFLKVYAKEGQPCNTCRYPILRIVQQQRSTFFCATCQV